MLQSGKLRQEERYLSPLSGSGWWLQKRHIANFSPGCSEAQTRKAGLGVRGEPEARH